LLPEFEKIIEEAKKVNITDEYLKKLMDKYDREND